jgi:hypothetical protein
MVEEKGKRFSLVYLDRGSPARDSQRFRNRLIAYYWENLHESHGDNIRKALQREAGIEIPSYYSLYRVDEVFRIGELRDVLVPRNIIFFV